MINKKAFKIGTKLASCLLTIKSNIQLKKTYGHFDWGQSKKEKRCLMQTPKHLLHTFGAKDDCNGTSNSRTKDQEPTRKAQKV